MSIIFGVRKSEGQVVEERQLRTLGHATDRYAPDGTFVRSKGRVGMGFQPFHTHERSNFESHPVFNERSNILTLDGRLDNHAELCNLLNIQNNETSDSLIMLTAYERWGADCFSRFIGDWAIALWSDIDRSLYLARDHAGARTLYYAVSDGYVCWSTCLETFFAEGKVNEFDDNYIADYLCCLPVQDKTPYKDIVAVTPAHYLIFHDDLITRKPHWKWMVKDKIRYRSDSEYEQHFFSLFQQSVERRTGTGAAIIAQLSGGMDSSSIVCMSDYIRSLGSPSVINLLETVSFYDDAETTWNERPYFSAVESHRGKSGIHIDSSFIDRLYRPLDSKVGCYLYPGGDRSSWERECHFLEALGKSEYRSVLSGIGGDEVLGGVPTCFPELADALFELNVHTFSAQAMRWGIAQRAPVIPLMGTTIKKMLQLYYGRSLEPPGNLPLWLGPRLSSRIQQTNGPRDILQEPSIWISPSAIINGQSWWTILNSLPHLNPGLIRRYEYRYPYLDRDLVDFLFRIPRDQLVRPGQRRSLMKRALAHILPARVLERRQKAFVLRGPLVSLQRNYQSLLLLLTNSNVERMGYVDAGRLHKSLTALVEGRDIATWPEILRAILLEIWLISIFGREAETNASSVSNREMVYEP
jgi:asparagine synthase (glutamine-hydrolysing)